MTSIVDPDNVQDVPLKTTVPEPEAKLPLFVKLPFIFNVDGAVTNPEAVIKTLLKIAELIVLPERIDEPLKIIVPLLWVNVPSKEKLPPTVKPVVAAEVGALNIPVQENDPTETLLLPDENVRALAGIENEFSTSIFCVSVTTVLEFVLIVKELRVPDEGISSPVDCELPV